MAIKSLRSWHINLVLMEALPTKHSMLWEKQCSNHATKPQPGKILPEHLCAHIISGVFSGSFSQFGGNCHQMEKNLIGGDEMREKCLFSVLRFKPYFPPRIIPVRSEKYPNSLLLTLAGGGTGEGREDLEGEGNGHNLSGWSREHGWETEASIPPENEM